MPILEQETARFEALREELVKRGETGRWIVISGERTVGVFDRELEALRAGRTVAPSAPILVREIRELDPHPMLLVAG